MSESSEGTTNVPNQLAILVPSYDPSKDDLQVYSQKVMLLLGGLAYGKIHRTSYSPDSEQQWISFQEVAITPDRGDSEWPKINSENPRAVGKATGVRLTLSNAMSMPRGRCTGANKNPMKAQTVFWRELTSCGQNWIAVSFNSVICKPMSLFVDRRYLAEDKKRVLLDADAANKGSLTVDKVSSAIRMLVRWFLPWDDSRT